MTEESAVKVCVRVRPLIAREESSSEDTEPVKHFWKANNKSIHQVDDENPTKSFCFDRVFTADESTNQLYQAIAKPLVVSAVEGYNGTIFAYGQTSSGKTFTMMGNGGSVPGVIPLAVEDVFQSITNLPKKEFLLRVSYMEIYNETVVDLLVSSWKRKPLEVRETINKNVFVADLMEEVVTSSAQALAWIRKGEKNRHYGKTKMNQRSSRSHTIFRMIIESRDRSDSVSGENADGGIIVSHLNLVDLAGSERASQTGAEGTRFKEGCNINRSLFTLAQVIKKLTDENQKLFTSYRDSKLTRILQNSLGGNAKTVIICTITPVALEETLSTLQFASTAKKMKNDPHVTEVSDDGALLKRYRNEIVDLKRRLHEVSSVTQTTATEKEVLSQLLQEKEMLQREQEDRIRNLTTLLVTSTTQTNVRKVPKRRVTWGGKMLKLVGPGAAEENPWDFNLSQSFMPKRKAYGSSLSELCEDDEDFDSQWEIPDEPQDDTETSQSSVTVRSFGDSPIGGSSDWMCELSSKVSTLELQLDLERRQKEKAWGEVEMLKSSVAKLQLEETSGELQSEETSGELEKTSGELQPEETSGELQTEETQPRLTELQLQLQTEAGLKQEAVEKVDMLQLKVADVEQQNHTLSETVEQMTRQFAETAQLCEALAKEKEEVLTERDYLRQELGMFIEQTNMLEEEKAALSQEVLELRETEEFKTLEDEFNREQQKELQMEISKLKTALESSEAQCLQLQSKLDGLSEQLKTKTEFAEELQSMGGKDLMQEVAKLRRSLDDAEGVSRDTKKDWALLRTENMALEESNVTLSTNHEKMGLEVNSLRVQLETEKSRYRNMQSDLQKELNLAFEENATLTSLLAGKVPKNLIDSFELEKTVSLLNKELAASREVQETLGAQLEEFPAKLDDLSKQVQQLSEELLLAEAGRQEEARLLREALEEVDRNKEQLSSGALREEDLRQQCEDMKQTMDSLGSDLQRAEAEGNRLQASVEEKLLQLEESQQLKESLEGRVEEMQRLVQDLEEKLADSEVSRSAEEDISRELQEQVTVLSEELQEVRAAMETLVSEQKAAVHSSAEETDKLLSTITSLSAEGEQLRAQTAAAQTVLESLQLELQQEKQRSSDLTKLCEQQESDVEKHELQSVGEQEAPVQASTQSCGAELDELRSTVASLSAERDQLRLDLQENVDIMIEVQDELRTAIQKNQKQKELIKELKASIPEDDPSETRAQLEELQAQIKSLKEELQSVEAERASLLSEKECGHDKSSDETRTLQHRVTSLSEEREELQEMLDTLRQEKQQLAAELEDSTQSLHTQMKSLGEELQQMKAERAQLEDGTQSLHTQLRRLTEELQSVEAERASLLSEKECGHEKSSDETRTLQHRVTSLSEEREELQEMLDTLRQEKQQLAAELEDSTQSLHTQMKSLGEELQQMKAERAQLEDGTQSLHTQVRRLTEELQSVEAERASLLSEKECGHEKSSDETRTLQHRVTSLSEEREELQEMLDTLRQEKQQLAAELEDSTQSLHTQMKSLGEELQQMKAERAQLEDGTQSLHTQVRRLTEELQSVEAERASLLSEKECGHEKSSDETRTLQHRVTSLSEEREELQEMLDTLRQEKQQLAAELEDSTQSLHTQMKSLGEELQQMKAERAQLEDGTQSLHTQVRSLTEKLLSLEAERDGLLSEKESSRRSVSEETQELQHRLTFLEEMRWEREEVLEELTLDKHLLQARLNLISSEMEEQRVEEERRRMEEQALLHQQVQQLEEQLQQHRERRDVTQQALCLQNEQLKEALVKASSCGCCPEQDSRHLLEERENTIRTLQSTLEESQTLVSQSAAELEKLKARVFQTEVALRSASDEHQKELQRLSAVLRDKEDSVRKLKETLRRQQGEESILTGAELHARLTQPRGLSRSSVQLEVEVQRLHRTVLELESVASSQQAEINKWKSRAVRLKSKAEADRAPSPRTPRRGFPFSDPPNFPHSPRKVRESPLKVLDSPHKVRVSPLKVLDSPNKVRESPRKVLDSPKSRFFDVGSSDALRRAAPKQFFDNSGLGTLPGAAVGPEKDFWPLSPTQQELCKTQ